LVLARYEEAQSGSAPKAAKTRPRGSS